MDPEAIADPKLVPAVTGTTATNLAIYVGKLHQRGANVACKPNFSVLDVRTIKTTLAVR